MQSLRGTQTSGQLFEQLYWHTDYAISASQRHSDPQLVCVLSYDICCQYHRNFQSRLEDYIPDSVKINVDVDRWLFVVPKLHIKGHGKKCQERFALHFLPGAAQTDGEGIERRWANLGPMATATIEMAPGHRRDTIDDHLGSSNWDKVVGLDARLQVASQSEFFELFCELQSENVAAWSALVEAWEDSGMDGSVQNPYSREEEGDAKIDIRLKYAQEEAQSTAYLHEVTPSTFIMLSLDIEEQHAQHIHNPLVFAIISQLPDTDTPAPPAEEAQLYLPSGLSHELRCHPDMKQRVDMETDYRRAQLRSSLEGIWTHLFVQTRLYSQKSIHIRHQKANTRARAIIDRNHRKIDELQQKYSASWAALKVMVGESFIGFKQLRPEDVVSYNDPDVKAVWNVCRALKRTHDGSQVVQPGESTRMLSWIWAGVDTSEDSAVMKDALRVEWCKSQAHFRRWVEELQLL
ncbi:hypothetical protein V5O48_018656 [Marasmius crinis-equi]|uniref:Uncharacterized protein n=1 Tax=Marasmius crinis-equi TaxID=585013 RepID=A0ABR3EKK5_9AGAR